MPKRNLQQIEENLRKKLEELYNVPLIDIDLGSDLDVVKRMQDYRDGKEPGGWNYDPGSRSSFIGGGGGGGRGRPGSAAKGPAQSPKGKSTVQRRVEPSMADKDAAAAARKRAEELLTGRGFKEKEGAKADTAKSTDKPRIQMKPGETQDQAMLRSRREEIAKSRNDQAGAKVWRPGGEPKVWRKGQTTDKPTDKPTIAREPQTPQEKMIAQAQADAAAGKPTLAVTDPRMSRILDKLFPEKGAKQRSQSGQRSKEKEGPLVWRYGPDGKSSRKVPGGKPPGKEPPMSADRSGRREIPDPLTAKEKRSAAYKSGGIHAAAALAALMALKKDKDIPDPGGSEANADDRGAVWVDLDNWTPTDTDSKDAVTEPKSSAAVTQDPATAPEKPIEEPEIRLEPAKPTPKTDITRPDKKSAEPEREAPKKDQPVPVPDPAPVPPAPSEKNVPSPGGSPGRTDTPSVQPKKEPGTTSDGTGDKPSPADGTGPKPGDTKGPDTGPGTRNYGPRTPREKMFDPDLLPEQTPDTTTNTTTNTTPDTTPDKTINTTHNTTPTSGTGKDYKPRTPREKMFDPNLLPESIELRLRNKYQNFLQENKKTPRETIEAYLGKRMTDSEYSAFLRTVGAESGKEPLERAHIASVILNRARAVKGDIIGVLNSPAQFQAITGPGAGNKGSVFRPYDGPKSNPNAKIILPGIDQDIASMLKLVPPGLTHFAAANRRAYGDEIGGEKKYRAIMKQYSNDPNRRRVFASVVGNLGPWPYNPNTNPVAREEQKLGDKFRDKFASLIVPGTTVQAGTTSSKKDSKTDKQDEQPGYYTVGDSHGQGIAVYGTSKNGPTWNNKSTVGASVVDKDQFATHMANIESIPAGSVVTISGGANDIGRPNHQAIVDNLNKLIAASKAKGHKVVYVLPTESPDPAKQKQREELRQTILKGVKDVPIVDLGMASEKDKQKVHLDSKGYNRIANNISDMFVPGVDKDKTASGSKEETFLDKLQRTLPPALGGKGELVSQVFGDKKKTAAAPAEPTAPRTPTAQPEKGKDERKSSFLDKDSDIIKQLSDPGVASSVTAVSPLIIPTMTASEILSNKLSGNKPEPEKPADKTSSTGKVTPAADTNIPNDRVVTPSTYLRNLDPTKYDEWSPEQQRAYDAEMERIQTDAGDKWSQRQAELNRQQKSKSSKREKSSDVTALLQKDQSGLTKARRELSDFEREFAARRAKGDPEFTWYTKDGKPYQVSTRLKGEKDLVPQAKRTKTPTFISKDFGNAQRLALDPDEEIVDVPKVTTTGSDRFNVSRPEPEPPAPSEISKALRDFERDQSIVDTSKKVASIDDEFSDINPQLNAPGQNIDWKTIAPELFDTDKDNKVSSAATFKESINTESSAELHDILRLAGRK